MVRYIDNGAATSAIAITPNDDTDLSGITRGIHCAGDGGTVALILADDTEAVTHYIAQGGYLPVRAKRVLSTGTDATSLVGWY